MSTLTHSDAPSKLAAIVPTGRLCNHMALGPQNDETRLQTFTNNLRSFPEYIQDQIQGINLTELWKHVEISYSPDGYPICGYRDGERLVHLNSVNPVEQARHWSQRIPIENLGSLFVYGSGFGYPLLEVLRKAHQDSIVVVFEPNLYIFAAMLHHFDFRPIFQAHSKCIFFLGEPTDFAPHFSRLMSTFGVFNLTAPSVLFTPSTRIFKQQYVDIHHHVFEWITQHIFARGNHHYDSLLGFHNMIENSQVVLENPYLSGLKDKFHNTPAFIISNGPSLDKNLHELKRVNGKGLILCCESAIVPLMKNGIKPDAIVVAERDPESYLYHFKDTNYPNDIALLALTVADPRTFASFHGPIIPIFRNQESTSHWLNQLLGDGSGLFGGINVSHLAYEIAVYLGANPVVFVGQDLAYGPAGVTHSKQSKYAEKGQDYIAGIQSLPTVYVEGNDGSLVASIQSWVEYRKWLERLIEQNPHVTVINATEGGAKIQGTQISKLANVVERYCLVNPSDRLSNLIDAEKQNINVTERQPKISHLKSELKQYMKIYRALHTFVLQSKANSERLWDTPEHLGESDLRQKYAEIYEQNRHAMYRFLQPSIHHLFFQQVILYGSHQINQLGSLNSLPKLREATRIQMELFDYLSVICESLIRNFHIATKKLAKKVYE